MMVKGHGPSQKLKGGLGEFLQIADDQASSRQEFLDGLVFQAQAEEFKTLSLGFPDGRQGIGSFIRLAIGQNQDDLAFLLPDGQLLHDPPQGLAQRRAAVRRQKELTVQPLTVFQDRGHGLTTGDGAPFLDDPGRVAAWKDGRPYADSPNFA